MIDNEEARIKEMSTQTENIQTFTYQFDSS